MTEIHIVRLDETAAKINKAIRQIDEGAELVPVVHGRWVDHFSCSVCGKWSIAGLDADVWTSYEPPFCPNCGAKMDGGDRND